MAFSKARDFHWLWREDESWRRNGGGCKDGGLHRQLEVAAWQHIDAACAEVCHGVMNAGMELRKQEGVLLSFLSGVYDAIILR